MNNRSYKKALQITQMFSFEACFGKMKTWVLALDMDLFPGSIKAFL